MHDGAPPLIHDAQVVLPCSELDGTLAFFTGPLGFRVDAIFPADSPRVAILSGHGLTLRLERGATGDPGTLRLACTDPGALARALAPDGTAELRAPNGTRLVLVEAAPAPVLPPLRPSLVVSRAAGGGWGTGRAGMRYRDLCPDRQGGRFIASHIQIPDAGPVPDYVHFHRVRFQMIFCHRGWVRVVYEDQGPPFLLEPGDCVLQASEIRHRVLDCSAGLEVIEIGSPAEHETLADHRLELPTQVLRPERTFAGQRFVRHHAAAASWAPARWPGFEQRDTGIGGATGGLAGVRVLRPCGATAAPASSHQGELLLYVVHRGQVALAAAGVEGSPLGPGDSAVIPAGLAHALEQASADLELLEVTLPALD
jgi:mannose-6-phosphate isomerase-like protein (cupin superfamily)